MSDQKRAILDKLQAGRAALESALREVRGEAWATAVFSEETTWSVSDILRHLVDAEHSMTALMARIRDGGEGAPADFNLDRWNAGRVAKARDKTPAELLAALAHNRGELLKFIDALAEADWEKQGRHGSLRIMTLAEICQIIADHESAHAADIRRALG